MDSIQDLLKKKANNIDEDGVADDLAIIQEELNRHFDGQVTAKKIDDKGVVLIVSKSSSMASEVRLKQHQLMRNLEKSTKNKLSRFHIRIQ